MQSDRQQNGYRALLHQQIPRYLDKVALSKYFPSDSVSMICDLLNVDEAQRAGTAQIINREYWRPYNRAYCARPSDLLTLGTLIVHCLCSKPLVDIPVCDPTAPHGLNRGEHGNRPGQLRQSRDEPQALQNVQIYLLRYNISSRMKCHILKSMLNPMQKNKNKRLSKDRAINAEIQRVLCRRMNRYGQSECGVGDAMLKMDCFPFYNCRSHELSQSRSKSRSATHFWKST